MKKLALTAVAALATAALVLPAGPASAALDTVDSTALRTAVTTDGILAHARAFQAIADANGGSRDTGSPGYDASAAYVAKTLRKAGYKITLQTFSLLTSSADVVSPEPRTLPVRTYVGSGGGDVTGRVGVAGGTTVPPRAGFPTQSGCVAGRFGKAPGRGAVALVEDGGCSPTVKATNARAAGYAAVLIFDADDDGIDRSAPLERTFPIPVVGLGFAEGARLAVAATAGPTTVHVVTRTDDPALRTTNVLADTPKGRTGLNVVVGGHLDSVPGSAGINDNGSGNAATLEVAVQMAKLGYLKKGRLQRQVRFAFWAGGVQGQLGSRHYVDTMSEARRASTYAVLDYRGLGSKNYLKFIYDGDGYDTGAGGPPGSGELKEQILRGPGLRGASIEQYKDNSDYYSFAVAGIPAGGANTDGFGRIRDPRDGDGEVDAPFDPCYHRACDDVSNLDPTILGVMGDLVAQTTLQLVVSKNGLFPDGS